MPGLSNAHLQSSFRTLTAMFAGAVLLTFGGVIYLSTVRSTVAVTPLAKPTAVLLHLTIGPAGSGVDVAGQVTREKLSATVIAKPKGGKPVPARARGTVIMHNETDTEQALTSGTRLQTTDNVIVRTQNKITIPANGVISVPAVADALGTSGEITPGRLILVALPPEARASIYGQVETAFTGGTILQSSSLGIDELTAASNEAQKQIAAQAGSSQPGKFITLIPDKVGIQPDADVPSDVYQVSVTMQVVTATYTPADIETRIKNAMLDILADDEALISVEPASIKFEQQPTTDRLTVIASASGRTAIRPTSSVLQPATMVDRPRADVVQSLLATNLIKSVDIRVQPFWRTTLPVDPTKIHIQLEPAELETKP